ncbi:hypothetical protein ACKI1I_18645 [Streptomyces turgidiscabies]|uniref:hypothetical protein n=1 Tax=Streptomyces TaxID=1883 RepID=UPI00076F00C8|nr:MULTISPECIES: hypothetical protein [Streptomyces]MDX3497864.1 hypothetical protein [Streptomyces turgidiscabies]GAQ69770.1 hypothetical protein T45_01501 [Streptomyces turgidiscabies]
MLTYAELPGFPTTDDRLRCLDCRRPQFDHPNRWIQYTPADLGNWLRSLQPQSLTQNAVIQDPYGNIGIHTPVCSYAGIPPVALWQEDPAIANEVRARLIAARMPTMPPTPPVRRTPRTPPFPGV